MANGDVINFNRYPSAMLDESEMKTLDIAMSCDPDRSSHYSHHNHHHHHHHHHHLQQQQQQQQSNHVIPNNLMTTTTTITPSSTAATSESCDSKSRRSQCLATSGVIVTGNGCEGGPGNGSSVGRNAWRSVVGGCRRLKERCQQDDDHANSFLSICSRVFLVVVNFFFLVSGWVLFGLGVWLHVYRESFLYAALFKDNPTGPMIITDRLSIVLIGVGGFVVTVCFLGCCGACTDSVCFLAFYALLLAIAILLQILLATLVPTLRHQILTNLATSMQYQIHYEYNSTGEPHPPNNHTYTGSYLLTTAWDSLQVKLNCCGSRGPIDYKESSWFNHTVFSDEAFVPYSCCVLLNSDPSKPIIKDENKCQMEALAAIFHYPNKTVPTDDDYHANVEGCHSAITDWFQQHEYIIGVLVLIILFQIINIVYACILMSWVRRSLVDYAWCDDEDF